MLVPTRQLLEVSALASPVCAMRALLHVKRLQGRQAHQADGGDEPPLHERGQRRLTVEGMPPGEAYERRMPAHPAAAHGASALLPT